MKRSALTAPPHLNLETKKWFLSVLDEYELEPHHIKLLTLAKVAQARLAIAEHGSIFPTVLAPTQTSSGVGGEFGTHRVRSAHTGAGPRLWFAVNGTACPSIE